MEDVQPMDESVIHLQEESDTESISSFCSSSSSCMTSITDLSIYHEFDCMIAELHAIQESQHFTIERLQCLEASFERWKEEKTDPLNESEDDLSKLYEIIEHLHRKALDEIETSLPSTFTDQLLHWIDSSERESDDESE